MGRTGNVCQRTVRIATSIPRSGDIATLGCQHVLAAHVRIVAARLDRCCRTRLSDKEMRLRRVLEDSASLPRVIGLHHPHHLCWVDMLGHSLDNTGVTCLTWIMKKP